MDANEELVATGKISDPFDPRNQEPEESVQAEVPRRKLVSLREAYGEEQLLEDLERRLLSLESLPSWPDGSHQGHGWGRSVNRKILGGGLARGELVAVGAKKAAAGKSSFLLQLVAGLNLKTEELLTGGGDGPLTPVILLSEMSPKKLLIRDASRWTGIDSRLLRAGRSAIQLQGNPEAIKSACREAMRGPLGNSRAHSFLVDRREAMSLGPVEVIADMAKEAERRYGGQGREVWPVVVIDPLQRFVDKAKNSVEATNDLVERLQEATERYGWITIFTSDTNKASATDREKLGAGVFRGSYNILHLPDIALIIDSSSDDSDRPGRSLTVSCLKGRDGGEGERAVLSRDLKTGRHWEEATSSSSKRVGSF